MRVCIPLIASYSRPIPLKSCWRPNWHRYYTPDEWKTIDSQLAIVSDFTGVEAESETTANRLLHAQQGKFVVPTLQIGDTYIHLAIRVRAVECCAVLVRIGVDVALENDARETAADLLLAEYIRQVRKLEKVQQLKLQQKSERMRLTKDAEDMVCNEPQLVHKWDQLHELCNLFVKACDQQLNVIADLEHVAWKLELQGEQVDTSLAAKLASKKRLQADVFNCRSLVHKTKPEDRPGFEPDPVIPADLQHELETISRFSFLSDGAELDTWLRSFERAATFVQASWRGYFLRKTFHGALRHKACVVIQANFRGILGRMKGDDRLLNACALKIQRAYHALAAVQQRRPPEH